MHNIACERSPNNALHTMANPLRGLAAVER